MKKEDDKKIRNKVQANKLLSVTLEMNLQYESQMTPLLPKIKSHVYFKCVSFETAQFNNLAQYARVYKLK